MPSRRRERSRREASVRENLTKLQLLQYSSSESEEETIQRRPARIRERKGQELRKSDILRKRKNRENETETERRERLQKQAEAKRRQRANETETQRKIRQQKSAERVRERRRQQSENQGMEKKETGETEAQKIERRRRNAERGRIQRLQETDEQRIARQRKKKKEYKIATEFITNMLNEINCIQNEVRTLKEQFKLKVHDAVQTAIKCNQRRQNNNESDNQADESTVIEKSHSLNNFSVSVRNEFTCAFCDRKFVTQLGLTIHQKEHLHDSKEFPCCVCTQVFNSYNSMSHHYLESHSFAVENESKEIIDEVIERSLQELEFCKTNKCPSCSQTFLHLAVFKRHVISEHRDNLDLLNSFTFICSQCNEPHITRKLLEAHWKNSCLHVWKETNKTESEKTDACVVCETCGIKLASDSELKIHKEKIHIEKSFRCEQCGNKYLTENHLKNHIAGVHTKKEIKFCCEMCGSKHRTLLMLTKHKNVAHSDDYEKPLECSICSKRFMNKSTLKDHVRSHTGEKPFKCSFCDKSYASLASKSVHEQSHKGYDCKMCGGSFQSYAELCAHRKLHKTDELGNADPGNTELMRTCEICEKSFNTYSSWYTHQKSHGADYICNLCEKSFTTLGGLKEHKYLHDSTNRFACSKCGKTFRQQGGFYQHRRLHHKKQKNVKIVKIEAKSLIETPVTNASSPSSIKSEVYSKQIKLSESTTTFHHPSSDDNLNENAEWQDSPEHEFIDELDLKDDHLYSKNENSKENVNSESRHHEQEHTEYYLTIEEGQPRSDTNSESAPPNYVDFSKANVPPALGPLASESSTQLGRDNNNTYSVSDQGLKILFINGESSTSLVKVESGCDDLEPTSEDLDRNENNVQEKHRKLSNTRFPLDPFSSQLTLKISKLKEYKCHPCEKTFFLSKYYNLHNLKKAHRWALRNFQKRQAEDVNSLRPGIKPKSEKYKKNHENESSDKLFECRHCFQKFPTKEQYKKHSARYKPNLSCSYCEKECFSFRRTNELIQHCTKEHPGQKPFKCELCGKLLNSAHGIKRHKMSFHFGLRRKDRGPLKLFARNKERKLREKNCLCELCGKAHYYPFQVKFHMKAVHEGESFPCDVCGKSFVRLVDLEVHKDRHTGKRPFLCPNCGKTFSTSSDLSGHIRTVHLKLLSKSKLARKQCKKTLEFQYHCSECPGKFTTQKTLTNHLQLHDPKRKYSCDLCGLRYKFHSNVLTHKSYVHSNKD